MALPYFPLFPDDFEADTPHLTMIEDGAYNRLMRLCWRTPGCSVPDDDAWLFRKLRARSEEEKEAVMAVVDEFFQRVDGRVFSPRLLAEFKKADKTSRKRSDAGRKGGRPQTAEKTRQEVKPGFPNDKAGLSDTRPCSEPEPDKDSEAYASDAGGVEAVDFAKAIFDAGVRFLTEHGTADRQARSVVGRWRKESTDRDIFDAFTAAKREGVIDPIPWITKRLKPDKPFAVSFDPSRFEGMQ